MVLEVSVDCPIANLCAYWLIDWLIDCWLFHCIASERDCEPRGLYPDSLQSIESVPQNFNEHARVDFLPKDKRSDLLWNKWIPPPPLELWLRKRLVCVCVWGVFASLTARLDLAFQQGWESLLGLQEGEGLGKSSNLREEFGIFPCDHWNGCNDLLYHCFLIHGIGMMYW